MNVGRKAEKGRTVGLTGDGKGQERPQWVFCSKTGDRNWGIVYEKTEREDKSTCSLPGFLAGEVYVLAWGHLLKLGAVSLF